MLIFTSSFLLLALLCNVEKVAAGDQQLASSKWASLVIWLNPALIKPCLQKAILPSRPHQVLEHIFSLKHQLYFTPRFSPGKRHDRLVAHRVLQRATKRWGPKMIKAAGKWRRDLFSAEGILVKAEGLFLIRCASNITFRKIIRSIYTQSPLGDNPEDVQAWCKLELASWYFGRRS